MFNPTLSNTENKSRSTVRLTAIAKPLALMAVLLSVSPAAFAIEPCDEDQMGAAEAACEEDFGYLVLSCGVTSSGSVVAECCPFGHCYPGEHIVSVDLDSHEELAEDDYRGDPVDPPPSPHDAVDLIDEEPGFSDDDGDIRGADDGDTDPDERLEIGACCVDLACIDDLTEDECQYEELGAWFASMDCADTVTECAAVDPGPPADADELVDEEPGFSDDDDDGDTGDDGFDTGDADDTSTDDEDASVDDDDTQSDGDVDTGPEVSDTSAGCSTVGQAGGGLMALILGALLGLTRRQVRLS